MDPQQRRNQLARVIADHDEVIRFDLHTALQCLEGSPTPALRERAVDLLTGVVKALKETQVLQEKLLGEAVQQSMRRKQA